MTELQVPCGLGRYSLSSGSWRRWQGWPHADIRVATLFLQTVRVGFCVPWPHLVPRGVPAPRRKCRAYTVWPRWCDLFSDYSDVGLCAQSVKLCRVLGPWSHLPGTANMSEHCTGGREVQGSQNHKYRPSLTHWPKMHSFPMISDIW